MLEKNESGGINELDNKAIERAKKADLVTLPPDISGTNCYNCKWISEHHTKTRGMCTYPKVRQLVNGRMCCIYWTNSEEYRPFKRREDL